MFLRHADFLGAIGALDEASRDQGFSLAQARTKGQPNSPRLRPTNLATTGGGGGGTGVSTRVQQQGRGRGGGRQPHGASGDGMPNSRQQGGTGSSSSNVVTVKLVNYHNEPQTIAIVLQRWNITGTKVVDAASATVLSDADQNDDPMAENTLEQPNLIVPKNFTGAMTVASDGSSVTLTMPPWSLLVAALELKVGVM